MTADERLKYLGALGLICDASVYVPEDIREMMEICLADACTDGSLRHRRIINRLEIEPT